VAEEENSVHAPEKKTLSRLCGRRVGEEGWRVCGGVEAVWEKRHNNGIKDLAARSKIPVGGADCKESVLLGAFWGYRVYGFGGCRGDAVKEIVTAFLSWTNIKIN